MEGRGACKSHSPDTPAQIDLAEKAVVLRLVFRWQSPVCCPEIPDKTNVIAANFSIPASAVQGAILTRLNDEAPALATALFGSAVPAWPLNPCWAACADDEQPPPDAELPVPIRVSLTHRAAKFSLPGTSPEKQFFDEAVDIEPYDWRQQPDCAPLKASDGVLLRQHDGRVLLWKASDMPHTVSAHGVHGDPGEENGRNLFTIDAMAPMIWQGLAVMPENAADRFVQSLKLDPLIVVGKKAERSGRGDT